MPKTKTLINLGSHIADPLNAFIKDARWRVMGYTIDRVTYKSNGDVHVLLGKQLLEPEPNELLSEHYNVLEVEIEKYANTTETPKA